MAVEWMEWLDTSMAGWRCGCLDSGCERGVALGGGWLEEGSVGGWLDGEAG